MKFRFGTLNGGTYTGKEDEIIDMMNDRRIDILGMAEMRMSGDELGKDLGGGFTLAYGGGQQGRRKHGVGLIFGPRLSPFIMEITPVNERIISASLKVKK